MLPTTRAIPVLRSKRIRAWPKHDKGGRADYMPVAQALTRDFPTDAHFTAYSLPSIPRRLSLDALRGETARSEIPSGIAMVMAVFDVDCAASHAGDLEAVDRWWIAEIEKVLVLLECHPGGFIYRTRGGYRVVYVLPTPSILRDDSDAEAWSLRYCAWVCYLRRQFGIVGDAACKDWTRLFRLPHATRDGAAPERRETIGSAQDIGTWDCAPSTEDRAAALRMNKRKPRRRKPRSKRPPDSAPYSGSGILWQLFTARTEIGPEVSPGVCAVVCPNEAAHTGGDPFDTSTVLYAPAEGEVFGHVHCLHAHCQGRTLRDTLGHFDQAEIDAAREAAGVPPPAVVTQVTVGAADVSGTSLDVLVPGTHIVDDDPVEVGTDDFANAVLEAIPDDVLYRMDIVVGRIVGERGEKRFVSLDENSTRLLVDRHVRLARAYVNKETGEAVTAFLPCKRDFAALILAAAVVSSRVRQLRLLVAHPVYLPGFRLVGPGWNVDGGVYYDEPPELEGLQPRANGALDVLTDLVVDWPFADEASRSNTFGLMLTRVLRPAILGPIPFHGAMASLERTGKGKLIDTVLGYAVGGCAVDLIQLGEREEEREKRITSLVISGVAAVHFDNISSTQCLDSPALASLATAWPNWRGRLLGVSKVPVLPNAAVWVLSANNLSAHGEIVKRCVPIFLQPRDEHPELRTDFVHPNCYAYGKQRRRVVLEALLGIVDAWKAAGCPPCPVVMGGFERWVEAVGGCLHHAGATEWMANFTKWITSADDTQVDAEVLVNAWALRHQQAEVTAADLLKLVEATGAFRFVLAKPTINGQLIALGSKVLKQLVNRPVKGWIVRRATSGSSATYRLERAIS